MTSVTDIVARPLAPIEIVLALALLGVVAVGVAFWRGLPGAWLRLGALAALVAALLDPALVTEDRRPLADVVLLVVDESASQTIETRAADTAAAADALEAALGPQPDEAAPIELRRVAVTGDGERGTEIAAAIAEAAATVAPGRLSGAVVVTDGAAADADRPVAAVTAAEGRPGAPVHVLVTGRDDEFDRRLVLESAPGFGIVGETVTIRFRVEESGSAPAATGSPRVRAFVDGQPAAFGFAQPGRPSTLTIELAHPGATVVELRLDPLEGELTERNNVAAFTVNGVRDRLRVLLVSGEPYAGERIWRNLLKADPSVDLVHFTILRPPQKQPLAATSELALIPFPTQELFEDKIEEFDLIIFDRYRNFGILYDEYILNIVNYVRDGGAVLVATGPAFAGPESIFHSPLAEILPASPTAEIVEQPFRPEVTPLGARHPVSRGLPGEVLAATADGPSAPEPSPGPAAAAPVPQPWGRWVRLVEVAAVSGQVVMQGAASRPLLVLDHVGEGRVALLASDNAWLWARGYDGGGPHAELLRRLAHWLMKEPELEEEALTATTVDGGFAIRRRSLALGDKAVEVEGPDGAVARVPLTAAGAGLWTAAVETEQLGLHRIVDAPDSAIADEGAERDPLSAIAVVGPAAPKEFADPVSSTEPLAGLAAASGGSVRRLGPGLEAGLPAVRRTREGRAAAGDGWIGLPRREAYEVEGVTLGAAAPPWVFFAIAALFAVAAWRVEGR